MFFETLFLFFPFLIKFQRIMRANCLLNGFSTLDCRTQRLKTGIGWAETRAHIPLHALSMSPILRARHHHFRNTGFAFRQCAQPDFPILLNLKTKTVAKKSKIVCTIGPKTESEEMLAKMLDAGMNVMRLNFSHGDYAEHGQRIRICAT